MAPLRYVSNNLHSSRPPFQTCAGLLAFDVKTNRTAETNPVDPPECFQLIDSCEQVPSHAELFPPLAVAKPGSVDAPTTAQHRVKWSKDPRGGWWLASAGESGFLRLQKFDKEYIENQLDFVEKINAMKPQQRGKNKQQKKEEEEEE